MLKMKTNRKLVVAVTFAGFLGGMMLYGCRSNQPAPSAAVEPTTQPEQFALFGPPPHKSGVELWSDNCQRCHNLRPPEEFSPAQWATLVHHMRLRANLTGEEEREITKFLQASD
jgi:hypothetical protein